MRKRVLTEKARSIAGRVLALALSMAMLLGTLLPPPPQSSFNVDADANQRVMDMIEVYRGRFDNPMDRGMRVSELRTIGVFMSNFFIPFGTRLNIGENNATATETDTTRAQMMRILTDIASFDTDFAEELVSTIMHTSAQTAADNPLFLGVRTGANGDIQSLTHGRDAPISYFEFYRLVSGAANASATDVQNFINGNDTSLIELSNNLEALNRNGYEISAPTSDQLDTMTNAMNSTEPNNFENTVSGVDFFVLYRREGSNRVEVFSFIPNLADFASTSRGGSAELRDFIVPPTQVMFQQIIANAGTENIIATSMHDHYFTGIEDSRTPITDALANGLAPIQLAGYSQMAWNMYADGFGNIILDTNAHQYIMIPAAMNPAIFNTLSPAPGGRTGTNTSLPLNNLQTIAASRIMQAGGNDGSNFITNMEVTADTSLTKVDLDLFGLARQRDSLGFRVADTAETYQIFPGNHRAGFDETFSGNLIARAGQFFTGISSLWSDDGSAYLNFLIAYHAVHNFNMHAGNNFDPRELGGDNIFDSWSSEPPSISAMHAAFPRATDLFAGGGNVILSVPRQVRVFPYMAMAANLGSANALLLPVMNLRQTGGHQAISDVVVINDLGIPISSFEDADATSNSNSALSNASNGKFGSATIFTGDGQLVTALGTSVLGTGSIFGQAPQLNTAPNVALDTSARDLGGNIFLTLLVAGDTNSAFGEALGWSLDFGAFPNIGSIAGVNQGFNALSDEQMARLQTWAYLALDPSSPQGAMYTAAAQNNNLSRFLVNLHEQMAGQGASAVNTGAAAYDASSALSFMHVPLLEDIPFFQTALDWYFSMIAYFMAFLIIVQILQVIFKRKSIQMGLLSILLFFICIIAPPLIIDSSVAFLNRQSSQVYSSKFAHWAMVQHQGYIAALNALAAGESVAELLDPTGTLNIDESMSSSSLHFQNLLILQNQANPSFAPAPVTIRWQSPKKSNYMFGLEDLFRDENGDRTATGGILMSFLRGNMSNQLFDPSGESLFVYRTILDINNYSRFIYGNTGGDVLFPTDENPQGSGIHRWSSSADAFRIMGLESAFSSYMGTGPNSLQGRIDNGFVPNLGGTSPDALRRIHLPLSSSTIASASVRSDLATMPRDGNWGITQSAYNVTPSNFNDHRTGLADQVDVLEDIPSNELVSIAAHALFTESPFYYFNWFLYDNGLTIDPVAAASDSERSVRDFLLSENNSFFFNHDIGRTQAGYGELRDFMDMSSLFHMVIPFLRQANEPLLVYSERFGTTPFPGISSDERDHSRYAQKGDDMLFRHTHNVNLLRLFGPYSAWVDLIVDSRLTDPVEIRFGGERQIVEDPLDPASYLIRPMIFSESEMHYWGVTDSGLTDVERRIIQTNRDTYNDFLQLVNYVNFDPAVVGNAMALLTTFNFNRNFSQTGLFEETRTLYPQTFELRNFSYDAYLRLILHAATGEAILGEGASNIYMTTLQNTGWWVGIPLVVNTFLATQALPISRFIALLGITFLSIISMLLYATGLGVDDSTDNIPWWKAILVPLLQFLGINFVMAWVLSFFMSSGLTSATGELTPTLSLGSPATTLFLLSGISLVVIVVHWYVIIRVFARLRGVSRDLIANVTSITRQGAHAAGAYVSNKLPVMGGTSKAAGMGNDVALQGGQTSADMGPDGADVPRMATTASNDTGTDYNAAIEKGKANTEITTSEGTTNKNNQKAVQPEKTAINNATPISDIASTQKTKASDLEEGKESNKKLEKKNTQKTSLNKFAKKEDYNKPLNK